MLQDPRFARLEAILSWSFEPTHPLLLVLKGGLSTGLLRYPIVLTLDDCAVFARLVRQVSERYGFEDPAPNTVDRWIARLDDRDVLDAAYASHEFAERRYPTALRSWQQQFCDDRGIPRERPSSIYLGNLFHLIWHIITDDGQLERWDGRIPWMGTG